MIDQLLVDGIAELLFLRGVLSPLVIARALGEEYGRVSYVLRSQRECFVQVSSYGPWGLSSRLLRQLRQAEELRSRQEREVQRFKLPAKLVFLEERQSRGEGIISVDARGRQVR